MRKRSKMHSYYFLRVWLLLFVIISMACLGILFSLVRSNDSAVRELNMHYSQLMVDQTVDVKEFIRGFDEMGDLLKKSEAFRRLSTASIDAVSKEQIDAAMEEAKGIYNWYAAYPYKQVAFVYMPRSGLLFDFPSWQVFTEKEKVLPFLNMSEESWNRLLNVKHEILVDTVLDGDMDFARLMVSQDLTDHMVFVTGISEAVISDMLRTNQLPDGSQIMLLTQGSQAITYANEQTEIFECPYTWEELQELPDVSVVKVQGISYYQYHVVLIDGALQQLAFVPADTYGTLSLHTVLLVAAAMWVVGIPLSLLLAKGIHRPIGNLVEHISVLREKDSGSENEIRFIEQAVQDLDEQTKRYQSQLSTQQKKLEELLFLQTMKGQYEIRDAFLNMCMEKGILDSGKRSVLVLFAVKIDSVNGSTNASELLQNYLYLDGQKQAYEEVLEPLPHVLVNDGSMLFGLLSLDETDPEHTLSELDRVRKEVCSQDGPTTSILLSTRFRAVSDLPNAYNEILELQHDMDWTGEYDVRKDYALFQTEEQQQGEQKDLCSLIQTMELQIRNGAFRAAEMTVQNICGQIVSGPQHFSGKLSIEAAFVASVIFQTLTQYLAAQEKKSDTQADKSVVQEKKTDAQQEEIRRCLESVISVADLKKRAGYVLNSLPEEESGKTETELQMEQAVSYIHAHYNDPMLSAGEAAQVAGMQPSVFSKAFKQYMKVPYLEYIHRLRIEAAKQYLGTCTLSEVAEKVGYTNTVTMNRAFKRYENTTPGNMTGNREK